MVFFAAFLVQKCYMWGFILDIYIKFWYITVSYFVKMLHLTICIKNTSQDRNYQFLFAEYK